MMESKIIEIRDRATFIPVIATKMGINEKASIEESGIDAYYLRHTGYGLECPLILVTTMNNPKSNYDAFDWGDRRTMLEAHLYINDHFDELEHGAVVDVEYVLGEVSKPKVSQRLG